MTLKVCALSSNTSYYKREIVEKNKQLHSYSVELRELVLPDTLYINLHGCSLIIHTARVPLPPHSTSND